jgi:hypothetical protein
MTNDDIREALLSQRQLHDADVPAQPGIYAFFLKPRGQLLPIEPAADGLLYVGMTRDGLDARNHFTHEHSGFSTLRRSFGAILRTHLQLQPCPRSAGASDSNTRNHAFAGDGEAVLSRWMRANLLVSHVALPGANIEKIEADLIKALEPPLNLLGWDNPQRPMIKRLRATCVAMAKDLGRRAA